MGPQNLGRPVRSGHLRWAKTGPALFHPSTSSNHHPTVASHAVTDKARLASESSRPVHRVPCGGMRVHARPAGWLAAGGSTRAMSERARSRARREGGRARGPQRDTA